MDNRIEAGISRIEYHNKNTFDLEAQSLENNFTGILCEKGKILTDITWYIPVLLNNMASHTCLVLTDITWYTKGSLLTLHGISQCYLITWQATHVWSSLTLQGLPSD